MQQTTYGYKSKVYLDTILGNLGKLQDFVSDFEEATPEEWQECIKDFDDILSIIQKLDKLQDKCYERFVEKLGNEHE